MCRIERNLAADPCGDGVLDPGEQCDEGPANAWDAACKPDCTLNVCGDGHVGPDERCDDGNTEGMDACSADCRHPLMLCAGGLIYACGDTVDDDGDGLIDLDDPECLSPCDNEEGVFDHQLPGQNADCTGDCFYDSNLGQGDDHCDYEPRCDPLLPMPECDALPEDVCLDKVLSPTTPSAAVRSHPMGATALAAVCSTAPRAGSACPTGRASAQPTRSRRARRARSSLRASTPASPRAASCACSTRSKISRRAARHRAATRGVALR